MNNKELAKLIIKEMRDDGWVVVDFHDSFIIDVEFPSRAAAEEALTKILDKAQ